MPQKDIIYEQYFQSETYNKMIKKERRQEQRSEEACQSVMSSKSFLGLLLEVPYRAASFKLGRSFVSWKTAPSVGRGRLVLNTSEPTAGSEELK